MVNVTRAFTAGVALVSMVLAAPLAEAVPTTQAAATAAVNTQASTVKGTIKANAKFAMSFVKANLPKSQQPAALDAIKKAEKDALAEVANRQKEFLHAISLTTNPTSLCALVSTFATLTTNTCTTSAGLMMMISTNPPTFTTDVSPPKVKTQPLNSATSMMSINLTFSVIVAATPGNPAGTISLGLEKVIIFKDKNGKPIGQTTKPIPGSSGTPDPKKPGKVDFDDTQMISVPSGAASIKVEVRVGSTHSGTGAVTLTRSVSSNNGAVKEE